MWVCLDRHKIAVDEVDSRDSEEEKHTFNGVEESGSRFC